MRKPRCAEGIPPPEDKYLRGYITCLKEVPYTGMRTNRNPLRRIVYVEADERGIVYEVLECGHRQLVKRDIYGETYAVRRRCRKCRRE